MGTFCAPSIITGQFCAQLGWSDVLTESSIDDLTMVGCDAVHADSMRAGQTNFPAPLQGEKREATHPQPRVEKQAIMIRKLSTCSYLLQWGSSKECGEVIMINLQLTRMITLRKFVLYTTPNAMQNSSCKRHQ